MDSNDTDILLEGHITGLKGLDINYSGDILSDDSDFETGPHASSPREDIYDNEFNSFSNYSATEMVTSTTETTDAITSKKSSSTFSTRVVETEDPEDVTTKSNGPVTSTPSPELEDEKEDVEYVPDESLMVSSSLDLSGVDTSSTEFTTPLPINDDTDRLEQVLAGAFIDEEDNSSEATTQQDSEKTDSIKTDSASTGIEREDEEQVATGASSYDDVSRSQQDDHHSEKSDNPLVFKMMRIKSVSNYGYTFTISQSFYCS